MKEFVLPNFWQIERNKDNYEIVNNWMNKYHHVSDSPYEYTDCSGFANNKGIKKISDDSLLQITTEQFIKYVLKEEVMNKEIVGWKLKEDCKQYADAALAIEGGLCIGKLIKIDQVLQSKHTESVNKFKQAGVLDLWFTPVYKEETLTFGGYDVAFKKVNSGIRITCNGETGTFSQLEAIYNYFKPNSTYFKFGSQEVKKVEYADKAAWNLDEDSTEPVSIKIGCTTGTWDEFVAIYNKAKSMI